MADLVYLVRHAAPPEDKRNRFWGRADPGVAVESLGQAAFLAPLVWESPARLFVSPLSRAVLTAGQLTGPLGLGAEPLDLLAEVDFGDFDGLTFSEIETKYPEQVDEWAKRHDQFAFPGGESIPDFLARAEQAWRFCVEAPERAVMAVTHAGIIAAWVCLFLQLPWTPRFAFRPAYSALTAFIRKKDESGWEMAFFNNTPEKRDNHGAPG